MGTAKSNDSDHEDLRTIARKLAAELARGRARAMVVANSNQWWESFVAYSMNDALLLAWQTDGDLREFRDLGVALDNLTQSAKVLENRQFERELREGLQRFEMTPGARFTIWGSFPTTPRVDAWELEVTSTRRVNGGLLFEGSLKKGPILAPFFRAGLPSQLSLNEVRSWRLNDERAVFRR